MNTEFDPYHRWLGIRPEEQPADHYRLLGLVRFEDDAEVIHDAAERQMGHVRRYGLGQHSALSQRILNELGAAKACLLDPKRKASYDERLRASALPVEDERLRDEPAAPPVVTSEPSASQAGNVNPDPRSDTANGLAWLESLGTSAVRLGSASAGRSWKPSSRRLAENAATRPPASAVKPSHPRPSLLDAILPRRLDAWLASVAGPHGARVHRLLRAVILASPFAAVGLVVLVLLAPLGSTPKRNPSSKPTPQLAEVKPADAKAQPAEMPKIEAERPAPKPSPESAPAEKPPVAPDLALAPFDHKKGEEHQAAWAAHLGIPIEMTNSIGMRFVLVPPGEFVMGSPEQEKEEAGNPSDEQQHRESITKPFYLSVYEVTQAEFENVMGGNPSYYSVNGGGKENLKGSDTERFPVENVSWDDAKGFCYRLTELAEEASSSHIYRLPTEAEWEFACRAGTETAFCYGDKVSTHLMNYRGNQGEFRSQDGPDLNRTTTVGSYPANVWGLHDMHGNVSEWCEDRYLSYNRSRTKDPQEAKSANERVHRGGMCGNWSAFSLRSAARHHAAPGTRHRDVGFRVLCEIPTRPDNLEPEKPSLDPSNASGPPDPAVGPSDGARAKRHQEACAQRLGAQIDITNSIGMKMTLIPPGEFLMGSPDSDSEARDDEKPQHRVQITKPFYLGIYEVTQAEYRKVTGGNPSRVKALGENAPVEYVSWEDAQEFCRKLSELPAERAAGRDYRLPTEAEWEYACRSGSSLRYACGDSDTSLNTYAWYGSSGAAQPVGQKQPNAWGLCDIQGNVYEWCQDWCDAKYYGQFKSEPAVDPRGPQQGTCRVLRGGSWFSDGRDCRPARRQFGAPGDRTLVDIAGFSDWGFRVAIQPSGQ